MNAHAIPLLLLLAGLLTPLWLIMLVSALKHEGLDSTMKLVWVLVIILVAPVGWLIYWLVAPNRPTRMELGMAELHHRKRKLVREAGLRPASPGHS